MSVKGLTQRSNYDTSRKVFSEPRVIDNTIQNQMNQHIHQLLNNKKLLEAKQAKVSLISLRNKWRQQQDKYNYQSEYDRIRGLLQGSVIKGTTSLHIKKRIDTLKEMDVGMRPTIKFDNLY